MSTGRCAWCEAPLERSWHVEHYLPREHFPLLQYCWANLLPSCSGCNTAKRTWKAPQELKDRRLLDPVLIGYSDGQPYDSAVVLPSFDDRPIEPTVDDPAKHLQFQPADCTWRAITPVGQCTIEKLFADKSYNNTMQSISVLAQEYAFGASSDRAVQETLKLIGHETLFETLVAYWRTFQAG